MPARSEYTISQMVIRAKANAFGKMMAIGESGTTGVPISIPFARQLNLIRATESSYTTLSEKNTLADEIGKYRFDVVAPNGLFTTNVFENGF